MSRRTRQVVSTIATLAVLLAVWWIQSADDGNEPRGRDDAAPSATPGVDDPTPSARPSRTPSPSSAATPRADDDGIAWVSLADLPPEAVQTVELIEDGGPYPYPGKDGSTFGNFEGVLPDRQRGYYAEYTVETPGLSHRGARRIIAGDGGELYWTEDHYESFERIR
ncbi:ribonuclease domain-containing protein [Nocardioides sp. Root190]|uniref:ribonuclease domain-containing protein n=1 Tax=Nocardioides sp. Root190 TaxID=1736488 RepID=UPI0009EB5F84|nr:ribonuclease domain-containing protein [Nocardioides sp. Root190]